MTFPPPPALIAGIILLGWPLIQIASVLLARPKREQMRSLAAELRHDYSQDDEALRTISRVVKESHGDAAIVLLPIVIPFAMLAFSFVELFSKSRPGLITAQRLERENKALSIEIMMLQEQVHSGVSKSKIYGDARIRRLKNLSFDIQAIRWPCSYMFMALGAIPFIPLVILASGLREAMHIVPRLARQFTTLIRLNPQGI